MQTHSYRQVSPRPCGAEQGAAEVVGTVEGAAEVVGAVEGAAEVVEVPALPPRHH